MSLNQNQTQLSTEDTVTARSNTETVADTQKSHVRGLSARFRAMKLQWKGYKEERCARKQRERGETALGSRPSTPFATEVQEDEDDPPADVTTPTPAITDDPVQKKARGSATGGALKLKSKTTRTAWAPTTSRSYGGSTTSAGDVNPLLVAAGLSSNDYSSPSYHSSSYDYSSSYHTSGGDYTSSADCGGGGGSGFD